jgi:hypothetical protein
MALSGRTKQRERERRFYRSALGPASWHGDSASQAELRLEFLLHPATATLSI